MTGLIISVVRTGTNRAEVAPQRFEGEPLLVDLPHRAHAAFAKERNRWAPALNGVLEQESGHGHGQGKEAPIHEDAEQGAGESDGSSVGF